MPSNTHRIVAAIATAALFVGGAWVASGFRDDPSETAASSTGKPSDYGITVNLHGARNDTGQLVVMVFDNAKAFDAMDPYGTVGYLTLPATTKAQRVDFPELNATYYAVVAFHDENMDEQLNFDDDWLPLEGYAVSGMNDLYEDPYFDYSLMVPGYPEDLTFFYWPRGFSGL